MIIDCHCHAGPGDGFRGPWNSGASLDSYLRRAARARIDKSVLFAAFHSDYRIANRAVGAIVLRNPARFFGFAFVHCERDRGRIRSMVEETVVEFGFRGIKIHRHDARISREACETAREFGLPILYDVVGEVASAELLSREFADVNFIIPHLGSYADDWAAQTAFVDLLRRLPNVYGDTSGVRNFDVLARAVRQAGPAKILFGTDGPWLHPGVELAKIHALDLSREGRDAVLSGNWRRLTERGLTASSMRRFDSTVHPRIEESP